MGIETGLKIDLYEARNLTKYVCLVKRGHSQTTITKFCPFLPHTCTYLSQVDIDQGIPFCYKVKSLYR